MKADNNILEDLVQKLARLVPADVGVLRKDLENNIRAIMQSGLQKLDLVTREEFELQAELLVRTREKLDRVEQQLVRLEQQAEKKSSPYG